MKVFSVFPVFRFGPVKLDIFAFDHDGEYISIKFDVVTELDFFE